MAQATEALWFQMQPVTLVEACCFRSRWNDELQSRKSTLRNRSLSLKAHLTLQHCTAVEGRRTSSLWSFALMAISWAGFKLLSSYGTNSLLACIQVCGFWGKNLTGLCRTWPKGHPTPLGWNRTCLWMNGSSQDPKSGGNPSQRSEGRSLLTVFERDVQQSPIVGIYSGSAISLHHRQTWRCRERCDAIFA